MAPGETPAGKVYHKGRFLSTQGEGEAPKLGSNSPTIGFCAFLQTHNMGIGGFRSFASTHDKSEILIVTGNVHPYYCQYISYMVFVSYFSPHVG